MHWKDEYRREWRKGYEAGRAYAEMVAEQGGTTEAMREYVVASYKTRTVAERAYRAGVLKGLSA